MIGIYDYTVLLTYISLLSATSGIIVSLTNFGGNAGHPYIGALFLMICGLCDAFDGRVARTKKDRSDFNKKYGIQIDSLSDVIAFGVLPACIGVAVIRTSPLCNSLLHAVGRPYGRLLLFLMYAVIVLYVLAAVIRLAYFNVTEEERQNTEDGCRKYYTGLPVTSASIIFPAVLLVNFGLNFDITVIYFVILLAVGFLFLLKIKVPKPGLRGILIMIGIGLVEGLLIILRRFILKM